MTNNKSSFVVGNGLTGVVVIAINALICPGVWSPYIGTADMTVPTVVTFVDHL